MNRVAGGMAVVCALAAAAPAAAQEPPREVQRPKSLEAAVDSSGIVPALEAVATSAGPELQRALGQLANTLGVLAQKVAENPELRTSAARAGRGMAEVAELAVIEQSAVLTEALRAMADRLEAIMREQEQQKSKDHVAGRAGGSK